MGNCDHTACLDIQFKSRLCILNPNRFEHLTRRFKSPDKQRPLVVACLGSDKKSRTLRQLFPGNEECKSRRNPSLCQVHADKFTADTDHPILFFNANPNTPVSTQHRTAACHETRSHPVKWTPPTAEKGATVILGKVLFLFSDVICIFADDFGGLDGVMRHLSLWLTSGTCSTLAEPVRPRVWIFVSSTPTNETQLEEERFLSRVRELNTDNVLSSIGFQRQSSTGRNSSVYKSLRSFILRKELKVMQTARSNASCLFTATHLALFYTHAIEWIANSSKQPFDFIQCSRLSNPVPCQYAQCLSEFLRLSHRSQISHDMVKSVLGSSVLLDASPPTMHRFGAADVFNVLYRSIFYRALGDGFAEDAIAFNANQRPSFVTSFTDDIFHQFVKYYEMMESNRLDPVAIHRDNLVRLSRYICWKRVKTNHSCLICFARRPEHALKCRHAICDLCVQRFGEVQTSEEYTFLFRSCPLCTDRSNLTVRLKPPTAGVRIVSIDGGGVRGIVPLEFWRLLQACFGTSYPLQSMFDVAFGTSAGGLIALGLFSKSWEVTDCINAFSRLANDLFGRADDPTHAWMSRLRWYIKCFLRDACYPTEGLERALKNEFGETERVFDCLSTEVSHTKVGVIASTISDGTPFLFTNYNGSDTRSKACGYRHIRSLKLDNEPLIWEAARATSAAPVLFKPFHLSSVGTFQDGGLRHNNPLNIALWETRQIWGAETNIDVVLSLGTGTVLKSETPQAPSFRNIFNDGFISRVCRSFYSSLDGEITWREIINNLTDDECGYFRLNLPLLGSEPGIDDVCAIESLRREVGDYKNNEKLTEIKIRLLSSSFFFELDEKPHLDETGHYLCEGTIRVRGKWQKVFTCLRGVSTSPIEFLKYEPGNELTLGSAQEICDICEGCNKFRKRVSFYVRHPSEIIELRLSIGQYRSRISGFPKKLEWFTAQQGLQYGFFDSRAYYNPPKPCECYSRHRKGQRCTEKRKRHASNLSMERPAKVKRVSSARTVA